MNSKKLHEQWRQIMRDAKADELKRDAQAMAQAHNRIVDRKNASLRMIERDLDDAEDQYRMAIRSHHELMDRLLDLQHERVTSLEREFSNKLEQLQNEFDKEREQIESAHARQKHDLERLIGAMQEEFNEQLANARSDFESTREEIKNRDSEDYNVLKLSLEHVIDDLEQQFEQAHQAYVTSTDARTQSLRQLTKNDQEAANTIAARMKKINRLQDSLQHWRKKISTTSREWEERNKALSEERNVMTQHYQNLRAKMNRFRNEQAEKLKSLTLNSNNAIKTLQGKLERAERILKLGEVCRKLETDEERVRPFRLAEQAGISMQSLPESSREEAEAFLREHDIDPSAMQYEFEPASSTASGEKGEQQGSALAANFKQGHNGFATFGTLQADGNEPLPEEECLVRFYRRYNNVILDVYAVQTERERVEKENADLRALLKRYLDGVSVNESVLSDPDNPLFITNERYQLAASQRGQQQQHQQVPLQLQYN